MDTNYTNYQFIDYPKVNVRFNGTLLATVSRTNFLVRRYRSCDRISRNGTKNLNDYQRGETCLLATNKQCCRQKKKQNT